MRPVAYVSQSLHDSSRRNEPKGGEEQTGPRRPIPEKKSWLCLNHMLLNFQTFSCNMFVTLIRAPYNLNVVLIPGTLSKTHKKAQVKGVQEAS